MSSPIDSQRLLCPPRIISPMDYDEHIGTFLVDIVKALSRIHISCKEI